MKELGNRYNNIKSYEADINVEFVNNLALKSIEEIGLFDDEEYDSYYDIVKMKSRINGKKKIISNK
jgi:hypothetical protein